MLKIIILLVLVALVLLVLAKNIVVVQQSRAYVVERLGAFQSVWGVGIHLKIPFIERIARKVSLKEQIADFPPQPVITKDNVTIQVDTVLFFCLLPGQLLTVHPGIFPVIESVPHLGITVILHIRRCWKPLFDNRVFVLR